MNNAFFTVKRTDVEGDTTVNGVSNPVVTAAVGREFSGYVWLDSDLDGRYDAAEPAIDGVKVILQKESGDNEWVDVASVTSAMRTIADNVEEHVYYEFTDIYPSGNYRVVFAAPDGEEIPVYQSSDCRLPADRSRTSERL